MGHSEPVAMAYGTDAHKPSGRRQKSVLTGRLETLGGVPSSTVHVLLLLQRT